MRRTAPPFEPRAAPPNFIEPPPIQDRPRRPVQRRPNGQNGQARRRAPQPGGRPPSRPRSKAKAQASRPTAKTARPGWFWRYRRVWFLFGLLLATALAGAAWVITRVPLPPEMPQAQSTIIYDGAGNQLAVLHGTENRFPVKLEQVPEITRKAVVAAEDRKFFSHTGIDPVGIARATWTDIRHGGYQQGGSTITQQYVKNVYPRGSNRTLLQKLREAVIAVKLERKYSKPEILERYMNTVYFGRGAYGIEAAAKAYFDIEVGQLGLRESSYLVGLIRSPSSSDVYSDPQRATAIRTIVLQAMVRDRAITGEQAAEVEQAPLQSYVIPPRQTQTTVTSSVKGVEYYVEYVRQQLLNRYGYTLDQVLRGGLRVYTTLDPRLQNIAYEAVYENTLDDPEDPAGALVALDDDGRVVAMVGGRDWATSKVNLAVGTDGGGSGRQAGSAFKSIVLAAGVRDGMSLDSSFKGPAKISFPGWEVNNYESESYGSINLVDATAHSVNTVYAQLVMSLGVDKVIDMAHELGVRSEITAVPSVALGSGEVSVLDMAGVYLTLAKEGMRVEPRVATRITTADDNVLLSDRPERKRVLERDQADLVNFALRQVVERGTGEKAQLSAGPACGKTGTTENYGDAWFVGFTNKLTAAVWMGYPQSSQTPMLGIHGVEKVSGGSLPATIWQKFMSEASPDSTCDYPVPEGYGHYLEPDVSYTDESSSSSDSSGSSPSTTVASSKSDDTPQAPVEPPVQVAPPVTEPPVVEPPDPPVIVTSPPTDEEPPDTPTPPRIPGGPRG